VWVVLFIVGQEGPRKELTLKWGICLIANLAAFFFAFGEEFAHFVGDWVQHNEY